MTDEDYVTVQATLKARTDKGILLEVDGVEGWVGRSCCHFSTDQAANGMKRGEQGEFQIMRWVAEKAGWL